ncbi:hypothetical protein [Agromyces ramosus]|uniref:Uncharacterized protein n=1 Tax=Agromyces ramosus TaxID=33879 RepID=A0ABU0R8Q9_9MICO|nr:hypothetical protein [Agromyces ramosus]MDQ0894445.1 hypothetical protein [Agromyces ramosus]
MNTTTDRDELLDVIDRLTIEHPYRAIIDGRSRWVRRDPLIGQLREAIASNRTGGNGLAASTSSVPFDSDALEQYDRLDGIILHQLRTDTDLMPHLTPEANLRAWYRVVNPTLTADEAEFWRKVWSPWEHTINAKLHPPIVLELIDTHTRKPYDCPECGMDWFEQILNSGPIPGSRPPKRWYDREKRIALTATYRPDGRGGLERSAVECGCCGYRVVGSSGVRGFAWDLEEHPDEAETDRA